MKNSSFSGLRRGEHIAITYFAYTALLSLVFLHDRRLILLATALPFAVWALAAAAGRCNGSGIQISREWAVPALVLAGYLQLEWFTRTPSPALQERFLAWDHWLLRDAGFGGLLRAGGSPLHWLLEFSYTMLYTIPPLSLGALYWLRRRPRAGHFVETFALGTFAAYALLPHFPTLAPRVAFPGQDLPLTTNAFRAFNLWLLGHFDITTSVFPSGHVAAAFSCAFGLVRAVPDHPKLCGAGLGAAVLVYLATIFGRYHYAADGFASILISVACWRILEALDAR